jgi:hypothetical protein
MSIFCVSYYKLFIKRPIVMQKLTMPIQSLGFLEISTQNSDTFYFRIILIELKKSCVANKTN